MPSFFLDVTLICDEHEEDWMSFLFVLNIVLG